MKSLDVLAALLPSLVPFPPLLPWRPTVPAALLALLKKDPVRVASVVVALLIVVVAAVTGVPVAVLLGELGVAVLALEKLRKTVAPLIDVVLHVDDVPEGAIPVFLHPEPGGLLTPTDEDDASVYDEDDVEDEDAPIYDDRA